MRALLLTQHFSPEVTAGRFRMEAFVQALAGRGHEVEVICPVPNHPGGMIHPGYRRRIRVRRREDGADITHLWVAVSAKKTFSRRLAYYSSYAAAASIAGALTARPDVVLASSPPLTVGAAGAITARRFRVPWLFDVRDVWPHSAIALGELRNPRLIALAERLESALYASAATIVTVSDAFKGQIADRAPAGKRIEVIANGTTAAWLEAGRREPARELLGTEAEFVWAYGGNIGLAHGLEVAVEAAELLGNGFRLVIIGDGPQRAAVFAQAERLRTGAVELRPLMPAADAARQLRAADALLVSERQERTVASKLYDYCALGRPVVAACRGELKRVVDRAGVGVSVPHGDAHALADAIRTLSQDAELRARLGQRGLEFAREHRREQQALRLAGILEELGDSGAVSPRASARSG